MSFADTFRRFLAAHPAPRVSPRGVNDPEARGTWNGPFMGPGAPSVPQYPTAEPRLYDYPTSANTNQVPRSEWGGLIPDFWTLWSAYHAMDVLQVAVTFRVQQICSLDWKLERRAGSGSLSKDGDEARRLIELPDPQMDYSFEQWLGSVLLEIYVTDALTIQPVKNVLGRTVGLPQINGMTIKPLVDYQRGGIPADPDPAFVQYINGTPFTWFTASELVYRPFRPRPYCNYGTSRVEKILQTAGLYRLHEKYARDWFTQGNIPEAAALMDPKMAATYTTQQFKENQEAMDLIAGQNVARRRVHVMPPWVQDVIQLKTFSFERALPDWLIRVFCIEFGVPSYLFTSETNRSTAKEMNEALYDTPLRLDLTSIKRLLDKLLRVSGYPELEFSWAKHLDYSKEAIEGITMLVDKGIMTVPESRLYLGLAEGEEATGAGAEDTELDDNGDPTDGSDPDGSSSGEANETPTDPSLPREGAEGDPVPVAKAAGSNVVSISTKGTTSPRAGSKVGKRFTGPDAVKRAALATSFSRPIAKSLRRQQSQIMKDALEKAAARGKKVKGA